jgi:threonine synthase
VDAKTIVAGLRVPQAIGDFLILDAIRQSGGTAVAVTDDEILAAMETLGSNEGILACPEGAATVAGLIKLVDAGKIDTEEQIVLFNTGGYQA